MGSQMKKWLQLGVLLLILVVVVRYLPAVTEAFSGNSSKVLVEKPGTPKGTFGQNDDPAEKLKLLEQLALENELFRWSMEFEDRNTSGEIFSSPDAEYFRQWFDANASSQTWENYIYWVEIFYSGNFVSQGWVKTSEEILAKKSGPETLKYVNVLGRVLAAEWSKHNKVRKINNLDMYRWGNELKSGNTTLQEISRKICDKLNGI